MGANYFLLLLFYYLLNPARDSLFLVELSPSQLPLVYILTALVAAPVTAAYADYARQPVAEPDHVFWQSWLDGAEALRTTSASCCNPSFAGTLAA